MASNSPGSIKLSTDSLIIVVLMLYCILNLFSKHYIQNCFFLTVDESEVGKTEVGEQGISPFGTAAYESLCLDLSFYYDCIFIYRRGNNWILESRHC